MNITEDEYMQHVDDSDGYCLSCCEWTVGGIEPDIQRHRCDNCGEHQVYGAEQLMLMGEIDLAEE